MASNSSNPAASSESSCPPDKRERPVRVDIVFDQRLVCASSASRDIGTRELHDGSAVIGRSSTRETSASRIRPSGKHRPRHKLSECSHVQSRPRGIGPWRQRRDGRPHTAATSCSESACSSTPAAMYSGPSRYGFQSVNGALDRPAPCPAVVVSGRANRSPVLMACRMLSRRGLAVALRLGNDPG